MFISIVIAFFVATFFATGFLYFFQVFEDISSA